tara:strand:- start:3189 stop:4016 length:828 start_codon:yes stop_codon:yes gene_type:complete
MNKLKGLITILVTILFIIVIRTIILNIYKKIFLSKLYIEGFRLSVIILNYNRPQNIPKIVKQLKKFKIIDDIIISHGKKETEILINDPIITNDTKLRNKYFSATRFELSNEAKNDYILFIDDDLYPHEYLLSDIMKNVKNDGFKNNKNLYGPVKRLCNDKYIHNEGQSKDESHRTNLFKYNIVLTKLAVVNKYTAIKVWDEIKKTKYINIIMENKGNGEDIIFATFINLLGGKNVYVAGKYFDLDYNNGYSSMDEHYRCRDKLCMEINNDNTLLF